MTRTVYSKSDNKTYVQGKIVSSGKIESNIEDSVIYDVDRELEEVKDYIHKKNAKKGEGCVEV